MFFILLILLLISVFLQGTVTTIPLGLVIILIMAILAKEKVFIFAFISGILIDILTLQTLGASSLFFLIFSWLLILYQRKYEINSYPFVILSSFAGTYLYLLLFGKGSLIQAALCSFL